MENAENQPHTLKERIRKDLAMLDDLKSSEDNFESIEYEESKNILDELYLRYKDRLPCITDGLRYIGLRDFILSNKRNYAELIKDDLSRIYKTMNDYLELD